MIVLVDTHLILWSASEPHRLSPAARKLLEGEDSELRFSAASIWEIAIKHARRREEFGADPKRLKTMLLANGWSELAVSSEHAAATMDLPPIHKDPFDRILIAQAQFEGVALATSDEIVARYPANIIRV